VTASRRWTGVAVVVLGAAVLGGCSGLSGRAADNVRGYADRDQHAILAELQGEPTLRGEPLAAVIRAMTFRPGGHLQQAEVLDDGAVRVRTYYDENLSTGAGITRREASVRLCVELVATPGEAPDVTLDDVACSGAAATIPKGTRVVHLD
jgi:hypothetical protein